MHLIRYEPFTGTRRSILEAHERNRNICIRYTHDELRDWRNLDLYFVLSVDHLREEPTIQKELIDFAFKKQIKKYHPDGTGYPKEAFMAIKKAYEIISDPILRKQYDSINFNDEIPIDRFYEEEDFFDVFAAVFSKNAKFSIEQPVPKIGDKNTPRKDIDEFYKFWNDFKSWRSFEMLDAEDATMGRYEKRNRDKQNKNKWVKLKNEDVMRIKRLVTIALRRDPRLNENKKVEVDESLLSGGWEAEEILTLTKLLAEIKVGEKNRFDLITKKLGEKTSKKRQSREVFLKANQIGATPKKE